MMQNYIEHIKYRFAGGFVNKHFLSGMRASIPAYLGVAVVGDFCGEFFR